MSYIGGAGGGGGIVIGATPITGGTPTDVLYVGAGPVVAQAPNFQIDGSGQGNVPSGAFLTFGGSGDCQLTRQPGGNALEIDNGTIGHYSGLYCADIHAGVAGQAGLGLFMDCNSSNIGTRLLRFQLSGAVHFDFGYDGINDVFFISNGTSGLEVCTRAGNTVHPNTSVFGWSPGADPITQQTPDIAVSRYSGGVLEVDNGTNTGSGGAFAKLFLGQEMDLFNSYTNGSNYEALKLIWNVGSSVWQVGTNQAGSGAARAVQLIGGGAMCATLGSGASGIFSTNWLVCPYNGTYGTSVSCQDANQTTSRDVFNKGDVGTIQILNGGVVCWGAGDVRTSTPDTGVSRSAAGVVAFGNGANNDASATILAKTKAGAPTTSDVPAGTWVLIRDTTNNTTKMYYNNAGTLQTVALV